MNSKLGWSLDHLSFSLFSICSCSSFSQEQSWVGVFDCRMATPSLYLMPYLSSRGGFFYVFPLSSVGQFIYSTSLWVLRVSHLPDLRYILESLPTSHSLQLHISIHSACPQDFSPVAHIPYLIKLHFSHPPFSSTHVLPSASHD